MNTQTKLEIMIEALQDVQNLQSIAEIENRLKQMFDALESSDHHLDAFSLGEDSSVD